MAVRYLRDTIVGTKEVLSGTLKKLLLLDRFVLTTPIFIISALQKKKTQFGLYMAGYRNRRALLITIPFLVYSAVIYQRRSHKLPSSFSRLPEAVPYPSVGLVTSRCLRPRSI